MYPPFRALPDKIPETGLEGQYGPYIAEPGLVHAANTALGLGMPLLLTGEPGCGKSDFAWAAARALHLPKPLLCQVRSDSRARDLLYHYDALIRFADAQAHAPRARDPRHYVSLRPLGVALMSSGRRQVVRIDEIDKAPRDLPNDLLLELDEGSFEIPEIGDLDLDGAPRSVHDRTFVDIEIRRDMTRPTSAARPLVIITSNAERQLPEPFLRRCVFFHIHYPTEARLLDILAGRFKDEPREFRELVARVFQALRDHSKDFIKAPTLAEMLQWTDALTRLYDRDHVADALSGLADALVDGKLPAATKERRGPSWHDLPGLCCLIKHRDDLTLIGANVRDASPA
jgi:MoxR-like ATPase